MPAESGWFIDEEEDEAPPVRRRQVIGAGAQRRRSGSWDADGNYLGRYGTHVPGTSIDAGSRRIGSPNLGAFAGLQNFLGQTGSRGSDYLRSMGIMPSYNGVPLDQAMAGNIQNQWTSGRDALPSGPSWGSSPSMFGTASANSPSFNHNRGPNGYWDRGRWVDAPQTPSVSNEGGMGGIGGIGNVGLRGGAGDLEANLGNTYSRILSQGGRALSPSQEQRLLGRGQGTIARGTQDAIQAARESAVRRGDTSGSTLPDVEARIRARGAADIADNRLTGETGFSRDAADRLLATMGSAGGYLGDRRRNEILLGQLASQGGFGGSGGLSAVLGL